MVSLELAKLEADFLESAEKYGQIILSELFLPAEKKTIQPQTHQVGGHLGGQKYIVGDMIFKVPDASLFMSSSRDYSQAMACAMKVAGHELAGIRLLSSYFFDNRSVSYCVLNFSFKNPSKSVRVCLPLACVIDYVGLRVLAMSILPISHLTLR